MCEGGNGRTPMECKKKSKRQRRIRGGKCPPSQSLDSRPSDPARNKTRGGSFWRGRIIVASALCEGIPRHVALHLPSPLRYLLSRFVSQKAAPKAAQKTSPLLSHDVNVLVRVYIYSV